MNPNSNEPESPVVGLHLGSGSHCLANWLNTDLEPNPALNIIAVNAGEPLAFADQSFEHVYSEHMIEHMPYERGALMIAESFRVLRPGGKLRIATPDFRFLMDLYSGPHSEIQERYLRWATERFSPNADGAYALFVINNFVRNWGHQFIYDEETLGRLMIRAGFVGVRRCKVGESEHSALRGLENTKRLPANFLELESMVLEAEKPDLLALRPSRVAIVRVSPVNIKHEWGLGTRVPPRLPELQTEAYSESFDYQTLWYDSFLSPDGASVVLVSPPLLNLKGALQSANASYSQEGRPLEAMHDEQDRSSETWIRLADETATKAVVLTGNGFGIPVPANENHGDWFADRRAIFTLNKDNDLEWIRDWLRYHVNEHGVNAVLIYDNASLTYTAEQLLATIASVSGVEVAVVVVWPFPFGPQGGGKDNLPWDSDYCQYGAFAHARWRFLHKARCFLNCDVDEWVVTPEGTTVFSLCESSREGWIVFSGRWCFARQRGDFGDSSKIRHKDHLWVDVNSPECGTKWAAVPSRIPLDIQWKIHRLWGLGAASSGGAYFWHFRSVNTSWKMSRFPRTNPNGLVLSEELQELFINAFV